MVDFAEGIGVGLVNGRIHLATTLDKVERCYRGVLRHAQSAFPRWSARYRIVGDRAKRDKEVHVAIVAVKKDTQVESEGCLQ